MQLGNFLPDLANQNKSLVQANTFLQQVNSSGFANFLKSAHRAYPENISDVSQYGIEQLYFDWLRTAYSYRRMFIQDLYLLAFDVAEIRTPLLHLRGEIFRKGLDEWEPTFVARCVQCRKEFDTQVETCDSCGSSEFEKPDPEQHKYFDEFRKNCNVFGQSLDEILATVEDDINIVDDMYIFLNKQYGMMENKIYSRVIEIRRLHPAVVEFDLDKNGLCENSHWFCPIHREKILPKPIKCPECGLDPVPVMYIWNHRGKRIYLSKDEVIHCSKFSPSETYGYSPLLTIMQKVLTLTGMDRFLYRYFFERKAPTGMILTYTDDTQSLEQERARIESKMMEDPTYLPWVAVSSKTQRGRTDFVKLFHTLQEMDYLPVRNEIRDRVAMIYGVPQIYMNVMEGIGGLSGQTQQLKVFSNVIEADQKRYNEKVFPQIMDAFGITDWRIKLQTPEEKVESVVLQQAQQKILIASTMLQMGFDVKLKPGIKTIDGLDFEFSGKPLTQKDQMAIAQQQQGQAQIGPAVQQGLEQAQNLPGHRLESGQYQDPNKRQVEEGELLE